MSKKEKRYFNDAYGLKNVEETKAHYAKWAQIYDKEIADEKGYRQPQRCAKALATVLEDKNARILDIGCGTGLSGVALQLAGYHNIDGCDLTPEMLQKAKALEIYHHLFETDLNNPPLDVADDSYDAATAVGVFSFGHVMPDALDDILRVIKPGGFLVIGLNDHFYEEGAFPAKLETLEGAGKLEILSRQHGIHLENVEGSTGWVITSIIS